MGMKLINIFFIIKYFFTLKSYKTEKTFLKLKTTKLTLKTTKSSIKFTSKTNLKSKSKTNAKLKSKTNAKLKSKTSQDPYQAVMLKTYSTLNGDHKLEVADDSARLANLVDSNTINLTSKFEERSKHARGIM